MHSVNFKSDEREIRLAHQANAIKFQRKLKQELIDTHATRRILFRIAGQWNGCGCMV